MLNSENQEMKVKICGITSYQDALGVVESGADAMGFVFYEPSKRFIRPQQAQAIINQLGSNVNIKKVALFVNASSIFVQKVLDKVNIDIIQFHGGESAAYCEQFNKPYIKAVAMNDKIDLDIIAKQYINACALLLDTPSQYFGGTGQAFDWAVIPRFEQKPLILAGGLTVSNVAQAIEQVNPFAVDVSSGVEESPGIKNIQLVKNFVENAKNA